MILGQLLPQAGNTVAQTSRFVFSEFQVLRTEEEVFRCLLLPVQTGSKFRKQNKRCSENHQHWKLVSQAEKEKPNFWPFLFLGVFGTLKD